MSTLNKNGAGDWLLDANTVSTSNLGISAFRGLWKKALRDCPYR